MNGITKEVMIAMLESQRNIKRAALWQKGDKFFKWLPVLLLWCIIGVGCENSRSKTLSCIVYQNKLNRGYAGVEEPGRTVNPLSQD